MIDKILLFIQAEPLLCALLGAAVALALALELTKGGPKIQVPQLVQMINHNEAVVVDVRSVQDFDKGHIPGSINIPMASVIENLSLIESKKGRPVLVCNNGTTTASLGEKLGDRGLKICRLHGGLSEWQAANIPLAKGRQDRPKHEKRRKKKHDRTAAKS